MSEPERARLEERFFADTALFDELAAAEDDLVDDYILGRLPGTDRQRFEEYYLASPERAQKLAAARQFREWMATQKRPKAVAGWWERLAASWRVPVWALGAAAAAVLVTAGSWLVLRQSGQPDGALQVAREQMPAPASVEPPPPEPPREPTAPKPKAAAALFAFTLLPGAMRGTAAGDTGLPRVVLPKDAAAARMILRLDQAPDLPAYRAAIETVEGRVVWQGAVEKGPGNQLRATIPLGGLAAGDYLVRVTGGVAGDESVADYPVRIAR